MRFFKHLTAFALVLACLLTLAACGAEQADGSEADSSETPPPADNGGEDVTLYEQDGVQIALPNEYLDLLRVDTDFPDAEENWKPLISVYEKASYEAAERDFGGGAGFLFGFLSMDQAAFEQFLSTGTPGMEVFAADGQRYYAYTFPTDVQFYRSGGEIDLESEDWKTWEKLCEIGPQVQADFLERNDLRPFNAQDVIAQISADDGAHVCVRYYPYFAKDGDTRIYYQLLLRQPVRQGEGGLWMVDQWMDERGLSYLYFPDSGKPAAEHYADLQKQCDAGEHPELLTPVGAAAAFVKDYFGHETSDGSFEAVPEVDRNYPERNKQLHRIVMDVMFDKDVDQRELLECVGTAADDNWGFLGRSMYGSDWFEPLMEALAESAVGEDQQWRDSMEIACLLATQDAQTDFRTPLSEILKTQFEADSQAFLAALREFSDEEQILIENCAGFSTHLLGAVVPSGLTGAMAPPDAPELVEALDP